MQHSATLSRDERIKSKKLIDALFTGGRSKSMTAFPLRAVYMTLEADAEQPTQILVSVPKRCFKHAVKRNRVKRQVREAYRRNKHLLQGKGLALAFIWLDTKLYDSGDVERQVTNLLRRIKEKLDGHPTGKAPADRNANGGNGEQQSDSHAKQEEGKP